MGSFEKVMGTAINHALKNRFIVASSFAFSRHAPSGYMSNSPMVTMVGFHVVLLKWYDTNRI